MRLSQGIRFRLITLLILIALSGLSIVTAQSETLPAPHEVEYDLGFDCPVSSTLDATGTVLWVLMDNCGGGRYSLRSFNVADGTPLNDEISDFKEAFAGLTYEDYIPTFNAPMAFTPDGWLEIVYYDENYDSKVIRLALDSGEVESPAADSLNTLLRSFGEFPESTVYNGDHTRAVAFGETSLHVLDLTAESELLEIPTEGESYASFPTFSADASRLYVATLNNPDDMQDYSSVLTVYSLPDGELLNTYDVPSAFLYISPDERYTVASIWEDELESMILVELATGQVSEPIRVSEGESRVTKCVNDGRDMSDVDFTTSGRLPVRDLEWLPDSSGFLTIHSYSGEGAGGGAPCLFNYSRLRSYTIQ